MKYQVLWHFEPFEPYEPREEPDISLRLVITSCLFWILLIGGIAGLRGCK